MDFMTGVWPEPIGVCRRGALLLLIVAFGTLNASAQSRNEKKPWEWTVDERIAERSNIAAARARVERSRQRGGGATTKRNGHFFWADVADEIDGRETPHLFLPSELFESVVRNAFVLQGWRAMFVDAALESGLPPQFWEELERISESYIQDLREEQRLAQARDNTAAATRASFQLQLCASRADALAQARAAFGPPLDVFLYRHVAPTRTVTSDTVADAARLRSRERGCR